MNEEFDYLVIGSGLAGLTFALHACSHGRVAVLTKATITESNTNYAQGGIAAAVGDSDDWTLHEKDTLEAGAGMCDPEAVRFLVQRAPAAVDWLRSIGARFDLELGREGGHSRHRIVHHADKTGWEVERSVCAAVAKEENIVVYEQTFVTSLVKDERGRICGALAYIADLGARSFSAPTVLVATGGCGKLYLHSTNPRVATADGIGLAIGAGAEVRNMHFMQFHPTTLMNSQKPGFLVTEALRGAGATLRNHKGRRFMYDYHTNLELAPRDIVSRAVHSEMQRLSTWCVYLDAAHLEHAGLQEEFPTVYSTLRQVGIEMEKEWVPVVPGQHYSCGGVVTDLNGRTNVPGLYASGEAACTGVHGANRLASNSLLEAMVFSMAAAESARETQQKGTAKEVCSKAKSIFEPEAVRIRSALQHVMTEHVGVVRSNVGLARANDEIEVLIAAYEATAEAPFSAYALETYNLLLAGRQTVSDAIGCKSNVGLHYNTDQVHSE